ncbi:C40 family peptidase [Bordetella sp. LUAb4]|uniref:C40 family peptidase n=1 Tax=Bordetella sp. LUAb4 TaxID=2843195 RepID=UPI00351D2D26
MNRYGHRLSRFLSPLLLNTRLARLGSVTLGVAILAGCANTGTSQRYDYASTDLEGYEAEWASNADDPIGMLLAEKLRRPSRGTGLAYKSSNGTDNVLMAGEALNYLGIRYRFGGSSPSTGFDCSGLVSYVAQQSLGLKLPRNAADIYQKVGMSVARNELQVGDLVFFNTMGRRYSHVGIYLGDDRFVHSPSAGGKVRIESMELAYWSKRYNGARRIDSTLIAQARAGN